MPSDFSVELPQPEAMDQQGGDCGRNGPNGEMQGRDYNAVLLKEALDQQDRGDRDENVLAEKHADIVCRRGIGLDGVAVVGVDGGPCFSAAASAIGATSGRTVWAWPAMETRPSAAVIWRNSR